MMLNPGFRLSHKYTIMKRKIKLIPYIIAISGVVIDVLIIFCSFFVMVIPYKYTILWGIRSIVIINLIIIARLQGKKLIC